MGLRKRIKSRNFTDDGLVNLLDALKKSKSKFWKSVAVRLSTPRNNRAVVNVNKIERLASDGFGMIVPGKVLGVGDLNKKVNVFAHSFSKKAAEKIEAAGGSASTIDDALKSNSQGKKLKLVI